MTRTLPLLRWLLSTAVLASLLFACAGRIDIPMLRTYLAVFASLGLVTVFSTDISLDQERREPGSGVDPASRPVTSFLFLATVTVASLDAGRFHWTRRVALSTQIAGLVVVVLAAALQVWAMAVNPFFSTAIRLQANRGHQIVTRGPYRFIRHPGYLAMICTMPATAIALGSSVALAPALGYSALILRRACIEDRFLKERLEGYGRYAEGVRGWLIPGLW